MNKRLLDILICPVSGQSLQIFGSNLVTPDGKYKYPIVDGISILLPNDIMHVDKFGVKKFYEEVGWKKKGNIYVDGDKYEDNRLVSKDYRHKCHIRVGRYMKNKGEFFLDAGSGPVQYEEYLTYSKNFKKRVCVDISLLALKEARRKLGDRGEYILADLTNLPFKDNVFDSAVSMHVIYHIPKFDQPKAFSEIYRTLKNKSSAVVVYSWPEGFNLLNWLGYIGRKIGLIKRPNSTGEFYFQPQKYRFIKKSLNFEYQIYVWRSVSVSFLQKYIKDNLFGKKILRMIYLLEDIFPKFFGRFGRYPLIVIKK